MGLNECGCEGGTENACQGSLAAMCMEMGVENSFRECGEKHGKPINLVFHPAILKSEQTEKWASIYIKKQYDKTCKTTNIMQIQN